MKANRRYGRYRKPRCSTTVTDEFEIELENLVDVSGEPCEFFVDITVESPGHGDQIAMNLCRAIRLAAYDAVDDFDERIEESDE